MNYILIGSILLALYFLGSIAFRQKSTHRGQRVVTKLSNDIQTFIKYLDQKYTPKDGEIDNVMSRIAKNFNPAQVYEHLGSGEGDTSYTIGKGEKMYVCIRGQGGKIHDNNTIIFVMLHEIAHIGNKEWGHSINDFWPIFKTILQDAVDYGIYTPVDYAKSPVAYCGMSINYNPLFDVNLHSA